MIIKARKLMVSLLIGIFGLVMVAGSTMPVYAAANASIYNSNSYLIMYNYFNFEAPENKIMLSAFFPDNAEKAYNLLWNTYKGKGEVMMKDVIDGKECSAEWFETYIVLRIKG